MASCLLASMRSVHIGRLLLACYLPLLMRLRGINAATGYGWKALVRARSAARICLSDVAE